MKLKVPSLYSILTAARDVAQSAERRTRSLMMVCGERAVEEDVGAV
jgi:hypothetical protein